MPFYPIGSSSSGPALSGPISLAAMQLQLRAAKLVNPLAGKLEINDEYRYSRLECDLGGSRQGLS
jgi:hypothetical protein